MNAGVILIDKPQGISSFQAVARVRKKTGIRKAGHTGTLDPMATGLLTICLGRATRFARFLTDAQKTYEGTITLGMETDSYDAQGKIISEKPVPRGLSRHDIQEAARRFTGRLLQAPPAFSAAKFQGRPLYKFARNGINIQKQPRPIQVFRFCIEAYESPVITFTIDCSKGTYIRSLAHDLGKALGCGAHLSSLRRIRNGELSVEKAVCLDDFIASSGPEEITRYILPVEFVLSHIPAIFVDERQATAIQHGQGMSLVSAMKRIEEQGACPQGEKPSYLRIITEGRGRLVCMARWPDTKAVIKNDDRIEILRVWNPN
ncbi:MAG: tRNA pseudouridine(55) synthase TruB [Thermodesulfatator sp.]|nr:MAG: tRNA pseudouridine(55) synthase TruB [Thermodesulfatator sp.]